LGAVTRRAGSGRARLAPAGLDLDSVLEPVARFLPLVRQRVDDALPKKARLAHLAPAVKHMLEKQGKYLRPALVLLSCGACGEDPRLAVEYAAVVELIHVCSLVFDDLLDGSELRRGRKTINAVWGDQTAFLSGTHMLLEASNRMAFENERTRRALMDTLNGMFEGETMQFQSLESFDLGEDAYMEIIAGKSASLMSGCCRMGALAAGAGEVEETLGAFGLELGLAFQIRDDVLDLVADPGKLGKKLWSDLRDARMTLPLIHCARVAASKDRRFLKSVFGCNGKRIDTRRIGNLVAETGSVGYCMKKANGLAEKAISRLDSLGESGCKAALAALCRFAVERDY
jgi:octaprenyl-diphosphate synthase